MGREPSNIFLDEKVVGGSTIYHCISGFVDHLWSLALPIGATRKVIMQG